jgi:UDP-N-acetylglucosamine 4-epimerase
MTESTLASDPIPTQWHALQSRLRAAPRCWLVTGAAGFIGSHLVAELLELGQQVVALDNFSSGHLENIIAVREAAGDNRSNLHVRVGDITDLEDCRNAMLHAGAPVNHVLHEAALGSVPHSIEDPLATHSTNVTGFVNMLVAARDAGVSSFVYASSSAVYGDHVGLPQVEHEIGAPLSPYALSKWINEEYAANFASVYGFRAIGLRYFNVFGARQDPNGPYAAVIPRWIENLLQGAPCTINGDGETTRDFLHVANVVQANLLAATAENPVAWNEAYNIALGERTTLNDLYVFIRDAIAATVPGVATLEPRFAPFRAGDVRHSVASIDKAHQLLGFAPQVPVDEGLRMTVDAYIAARRA